MTAREPNGRTDKSIESHNSQPARVVGTVTEVQSAPHREERHEHVTVEARDCFDGAELRLLLDDDREIYVHFDHHSRRQVAAVVDADEPTGETDG